MGKIALVTGGTRGYVMKALGHSEELAHFALKAWTLLSNVGHQRWR